MNDSQKNHELLLQLKNQQDRIWTELAGDKELKRKGMSERLTDVETKLQDIENKGVRIKWWWMGASAAGGAAAVVGGKTAWAKILAFFAAR